MLSCPVFLSVKLRNKLFWFVSEWLYQAHNAPFPVSGWAFLNRLASRFEVRTSYWTLLFKGYLVNPVVDDGRTRQLNFTFWNHLRNAFLIMVSLIVLVKIKDLQLSFFSGYVAPIYPVNYLKMIFTNLLRTSSFFILLLIICGDFPKRFAIWLPSFNQSIFYHLSFVSLLG